MTTRRFIAELKKIAARFPGEHFFLYDKKRKRWTATSLTPAVADLLIKALTSGALKEPAFPTGLISQSRSRKSETSIAPLLKLIKWLMTQDHNPITRTIDLATALETIADKARIPLEGVVTTLTPRERKLLRYLESHPLADMPVLYRSIWKKGFSEFGRWNITRLTKSLETKLGTHRIYTTGNYVRFELL